MAKPKNVSQLIVLFQPVRTIKLCPESVVLTHAHQVSEEESRVIWWGFYQTFHIFHPLLLVLILQLCYSICGNWPCDCFVAGSNSEAAELAIIISLSVGLLLLLVLLIVVIHRNRKKTQRDRMRNEVLEQSQNLRPSKLWHFSNLPDIAFLDLAGYLSNWK